MNNFLFLLLLFVILPVIFVVVIIFIYFNANSVNSKNAKAANYLSNELKSFKGKGYFIMSKVCIDLNWSMAFADHILISQFGIFCVYNDFSNGELSGNENDKNLLSIKGKKVKYIPNPITAYEKRTDTINSIISQITDYRAKTIFQGGQAPH